MAIITVYDQSAPFVNFDNNEHVLIVNDTTPITFIVNWILVRAKLYNSEMVLLSIVCHSIGTKLPDGTVKHGGNGLELGQGYLTIDNLSQLKPLAGWLDQVDIHACAAAAINYTGAPGQTNYSGQGDGNLYCSRMAQILQTNVRASTSDQSIDPFTSRVPWQGTVLTYGPLGQVLTAQDFPT